MGTPRQDCAQNDEVSLTGSSSLVDASVGVEDSDAEPTPPIESETFVAALRPQTPSRTPVVLLLLLWGAYRAVSWHLLGVGFTTWPEAVQGVAWDGAVITSFVLGARIPGFSVLAAWAVLCRVVDLASCVAARSHVSPVAWWHLDPSAWRVAVEAGAPVVLGGGLGLAWLAARLVRRMGRRHPASTGRARLAAVAVWIVMCAQVAFTPRHAMHAGGMPEVDIPRSALTFWGWRPPTEHASPTAAAVARWRQYGWISGGMRLSLDMATQRPPPSVDRGPKKGVLETVNQALGGRGRAVRTGPALRPGPAKGAVVIFLESMNAGWSQLYFKDAPLPTPGLGSIAANGALVIGVLTQARPTHNGLVASLCGVLPGTWPLDAARGRIVPHLPGCLPAAVTRAGGDAIFMQGSPLSFSGLDRTLTAMGFSGRLGLRELKEQGGVGADVERGPWGLRDRDLYAAARTKLRQLRHTNRPFLLVVSAVDGHLPGSADAGCPAKGPPAQRAQACADLALLRFITDVRSDGVEDTILVATADHAAPDVPAVREAMPRGAAGSFAPIPLVMSGPGISPSRGARRVRVAGGQLDLPSTLAARLGLPALPGVDLLSHQGRGRIRLGTMGRRRVGIASDTSRVEAALGEIEKRCRVGQLLGLHGEPALLACDVAQFLSFLDESWHNDRLSRVRTTGHARESRPSRRAMTP